MTLTIPRRARAPAPALALLVCLVAPALVACGGSLARAPGSASTAEGASGRERAALARFEEAAGAPVPHFRLMQVSGYTALGERHLAVWTRVNQAWLLQVEGPCMRLPWTTGLGITSSLGQVHARFDHIVVGRERCRILSIRPVDTAALREAEQRPTGTTMAVMQRA